MNVNTIPKQHNNISRELYSVQGIGTRKGAMLFIAAAILCLLGFFQSFGASQYRNTGVVDAKDSGNQPANSKARCLLNCSFHRIDSNKDNKMDANGAFKVSREPKYTVHFYLI